MDPMVSTSFGETSVHLQENVLSPTEEILSIFPESSCIETDVVAEELQRVRLDKVENQINKRFIKFEPFPRLASKPRHSA